MSTTITLYDETLPGARTEALRLDLLTSRLTLRELIRARIAEEVRLYHATPPGAPFRGLVTPTPAERLLNGPKDHIAPKRRVDAEAQCARALEAFRRNGFFVLVGDRQVEDLDDEIELKVGTDISFVKLVRSWEGNAVTSLIDQAKQFLGSADRTEAEANRLTSAFAEETKDIDSWSLKPKDHAAGRAVLDGPLEVQVAVLVQLCECMAAGPAQYHEVVSRLDVLASALFARSLPCTASDLERMMVACRLPAENRRYYVLQRWGGVARVAQRFVDAGNTLTPPMREQLALARTGLVPYNQPEFRKVKRAVSELLGESQAGLPDAGERWPTLPVRKPITRRSGRRSLPMRPRRTAASRMPSGWQKPRRTGRPWARLRSASASRPG